MKLFYKTLIVFAVIAVVVYMNFSLYLESRYRRLFDWEIESLTAKAYNNDMDAVTRLDFYYSIYLDEVDINQAIDFYKTIGGKSSLSGLLLHRGFSSDVSEAIAIRKELADNNNTSAMLVLKDMYERGEYVEQNSSKALYWAIKHDCQVSIYEYRNVTELLFDGSFSDIYNMSFAYAIIFKNLTLYKNHYAAAQNEISKRKYSKSIEHYNRLKTMLMPKLTQTEIEYIDTHYDEIIDQDCQAIEQEPK